MKNALKESRLRELAYQAGCDPRSINNAYQGLPVNGMAGQRARAILKEHGLIPRDAPEPQKS